MIITLKDGSSKEYAAPMSVIDIAADISEGLARVACAGEIDGKEVDLRIVVDKDCSLNILTVSDKAGLQVVRHTASHVLAEAVKRIYPVEIICRIRGHNFIYHHCPYRFWIYCYTVQLKFFAPNV